MATKKSAAKKSPARKSSAANKSRRPKVKARRGARRPNEAPKEIAVFDPDAVEQILDIMPGEDALTDAADMIQGMAHPSRLKALIALSVGELCVGDIAAVVGLSLSATSTMLKQLRNLGLLSTRSVGKQTYYRVQSQVPSEVMGVVFAATADGE